MLTLKVITPTGATDNISCDSIILMIADSRESDGGGLYGIRTGHADSLFATDKGKIIAKKDGKTVFEEEYGAGFADCKNNTVTVITEKITE